MTQPTYEQHNTTHYNYLRHQQAESQRPAWKRVGGTALLNNLRTMNKAIKYIKSHALAIVAVILLIGLATTSVVFYIKWDSTDTKLRITREELGRATRNNIDKTALLKETEENFQSCAMVASVIKDSAEELTEIIVAYEDTSVDTIAWLVDNCYFYNDEHITASIIAERHKTKTARLIERFGEAIEWMAY